jgi:anti-sigma regulatory factor (Ser/Thr protein kinase)
LEAGVIKKERKGRYPHYHLADTIFEYTYLIQDAQDEDLIWRRDISPRLIDVPQNVRQISQYGFTEIVNNAIEHSGSEKFTITLTVNARDIKFEITDYGIGIFNKIKNDLALEDPRHAILELAKGKFTSAPQKHSGEGVLFTSRIFDYFSIHSEHLSFFGHKDDDWLFEGPQGAGLNGTRVIMVIRKSSSLLLADIFNEYADPDKQPGFHKTAIPVQLLQYEGESLMSRSQAKRLITRFDRFLEVVLDFTGVDMIGQGFADELFRVFAEAHPQVRLSPINCNENVRNMIRHVQAI